MSTRTFSITLEVEVDDVPAFIAAAKEYARERGYDEESVATIDTDLGYGVVVCFDNHAPYPPGCQVVDSHVEEVTGA